MEYNNEIKFYLALQILKQDEFKDKFLIIDNYYKELDNIVEDYKRYDDKNKSLLDSIDNYIKNNIGYLIWYFKVYNCFE